MDELKIATCIKNQNKEVLFQDNLSIRLCGNLVGQVCDKGCMKAYACIPGMTLIKNSTVEENIVDAVVINNGQTLTTLVYPHDETYFNVETEKENLIELGLTKSEVNIFLMVMQGKNNFQIAKELFISKTTLKTHLNNIYKKLPSEYEQYKHRH